MKFSEMVKQFERALPGAESFKTAKAHCDAIMQDEPFQTAAAFLIAGFCRTYVLLYEDQAVTSEFASKNQQQLLHYMQILDQALATQEPAKVYIAINDVLQHYLVSDRIF